MKNYCIISNNIKDKDFTLMQEIAAYIRQRGGTAACVSAHEGARRHLDFEVSSIPTDTECVMVLGGDGTMIRVATRLESMQVPLVGVNLGHLGYLCELDRENVFAAVDRMMLGSCVVEERMMLSGGKTLAAGRSEAAGSTHGESCKQTVDRPQTAADNAQDTAVPFEKADPVHMRSALNDIVIRQEDGMSIVRLRVSVNGEFLTTYEADGIILATPTGSTGYNMSAGGPIVEPKARMILLTPLNAHSLSSKSIVLGADDVIEIEIAPRRPDITERAVVSFDGDIGTCLDPGERLTVRQSENVTSICKLNKESFLEIMRKKMEGI